MPNPKNTLTDADRARHEARMDRIKAVLGVRTQMELAEKIGVRQSSVSDAKRRGSIPADWLLTIWRRTGVSPDWILDGDACAHRYLVPADEAAEPVNAVAIRREVEADVRAEMDNLDAGELIRRLRDRLPPFRLTILSTEGGFEEFAPLGDPGFPVMRGA